MYLVMLNCIEYMFTMVISIVAVVAFWDQGEDRRERQEHQKHLLMSIHCSNTAKHSKL